MSVFRNNQSFDKRTPKQFLKQSKPNVVLYRWIPQRQFFGLQQPNEKGSFFQPGANTSDQNKPGGRDDDEKFLYTQPQDASLFGQANTNYRITPGSPRFVLGAQPSAVSPTGSSGGGTGGGGGGAGGGGGGAGGGGGRLK